MYTFKPYTERVGRLKAAVRDRLMVADATKARLQLEAKKKYIKYPPMLQKPYISLYVLERMPLNIHEDEYFFGGMGNKGWGAANTGGAGIMWLSVDIENTWPIMEDGLHHAPLDDPFYSKQLMAISPEDLKELREIAKVDGAEINPEKVGCMVGTMLGMYATGAGRDSDNRAEFDWFEMI